MAAPKLTDEQRRVVLLLIAADYSNAVIFDRLSKLDEFPDISASALSYYRDKFGEDIKRLRKERDDAALSTGLALKAERVQRLKEHADELELMKWVAAESGRLWNEKAWRETLDDIAREMGERRPSDADAGPGESVKIYIGIDAEKV